MKREFCFILVLWQIVGFVFSQAPGDADNFCTERSSSILPPVYPPNFKSLMDSYNYIELLPVIKMPDHGVWQEVDIDFLTNSTNNDPTNHVSIYYL